MPKVEDIFSKLNGAKYFSTLDLRADYHHVPLDKSLKPKQHLTLPLASMNTSRLPFGLAQAPAYFSRINDCNLEGL